MWSNRSINLAEVDFFSVCLRLPKEICRSGGRPHSALTGVAVRCETRVWAGEGEGVQGRRPLFNVKCEGRGRKERNGERERGTGSPLKERVYYVSEGKKLEGNGPMDERATRAMRNKLVMLYLCILS